MGHAYKNESCNLSVRSDRNTLSKINVKKLISQGSMALEKDRLTQIDIEDFAWMGSLPAIALC